MHHRRISELSGLVRTCFPLPGQPAARLFIFHTGIWCDLQRDINPGRSRQPQPDSGVDHGQPGHGTGQLSTFRLDRGAREDREQKTEDRGRSFEFGIGNAERKKRTEEGERE